MDTMKTATTSAPVIPAKKVNGSDVFSQNGEHLGEIDDVMIEKRSGEVVYAIMSFGGFLGIGEKYHPLPWPVLNYDKGKDGYVVNLTKEQLKRAPYYARDELSDNDLAWRQKVFDYYETPPYWV
jgi:uncharacterized protein YrrD